jgi:hypothetical protein
MNFVALSIFNSMDQTTCIILCSLLFSIITGFGIFQFMKNQKLKDDERMQKSIMETCQNLHFKYYELALEERNKASELKNEISNYLQIINALVLSENEKEKIIAREMIEELKKEVANINETQYCENSIINIIVALKNNEAKNLGIKTEILMEVPESVKIDRIDLCGMFNSLFDNAISECKKNGENSSITVKAGVKLDYLIIKFTNPTNQMCQNNDDGKISIDFYKKTNAIDFKIIDEIAKKYSGHIEINNKDNKVYTIVSLKI